MTSNGLAGTEGPSPSANVGDFAGIRGDTENPLPVFPGGRFLLLPVSVAPVVASSGPFFSTSTRLLGVW